jgi:hypothetical protein
MRNSNLPEGPHKTMRRHTCNGQQNAVSPLSGRPQGPRLFEPRFVEGVNFVGNCREGDGLGCLMVRCVRLSTLSVMATLVIA